MSRRHNPLPLWTYGSVPRSSGPRYVKGPGVTFYDANRVSGYDVDVYRTRAGVEERIGQFRAVNYGGSKGVRYELVRVMHPDYNGLIWPSRVGYHGGTKNWRTVDGAIKALLRIADGKVPVQDKWKSEGALQRARRNGKKGDFKVTSTNISALKDWVEAGQPARVDAVDLPHLRRCIRGGLIGPDMRLTAAGKAALDARAARYRR